MKTITSAAFVFFVMIASCLRADPLFDSNASLEFSLAGPFKLIAKDKNKDKTWPGVLSRKIASDQNLDDQALSENAPSKQRAQFDVKLSLRGNRRLAECKYPPLRVDFKKKQIKNSVFEHQGDIKLVVQCDDRKSAADYLRLEFLIYKALNLLTPASYQVRWVEMNYFDQDEKPAKQNRQMPAFFVERKSRLAKRLGAEKTELSQTSIETLEPEQATLLSLFQYVVGNPDYSLVAAAPGQSCCHNAKLLLTQGGEYMPVIYDFDSSGLIDARYAIPAHGLGIKSVTERLFRGYCQHNVHLDGARGSLLAQEKTIKALFQDDPILRERAKKRSLKFLDTSFERLRTAKNLSRHITRECRG